MSGDEAAAKAGGGRPRWKRYPKYRESGIAWLGEVPEHWGVRRLRFDAQFNPPRSQVSNLRPDTLVSFVPMEAVSEWGGLDLSDSRPVEAIGSGYTLFMEGDVVVAKITPCFENCKGALAAGLTSGVAFGTTELHVIRPDDGLDARFLFYLTMSHGFRHVGASTMYGAGGQKRVPDDYLRDFRPALPPLEEQRAIADFLDGETGRIDTLLAKKELLAKLLDEKRRAMTSQVVTRGLDPTVTMKDSGVPWLREIPAHWAVVKLKFSTNRIVDCPHSTPKYSPIGNYLVVRTADVTPGKIESGRMYRIELDEYLKRTLRCTLEPGDLVYGREGERYGIAAQVMDGPRMCLGQRMMQIRANNQSLCSRYLMWALNSDSTYAQIEIDTFGSASPHVNMEAIRNFLLPQPPLLEQNEIISIIDATTNRLEVLIKWLGMSDSLLREHRQALITAAVTGQIDVRQEVPA